MYVICLFVFVFTWLFDGGMFLCLFRQLKFRAGSFKHTIE